jgi:hypothetical protein
VSNAARVWGVKLLQRRQNSEDAANACERRYRLDKLGVTGSSPVPPIQSPVNRAFRLLSGRRIQLGANSRFVSTAQSASLHVIRARPC